MHAASLPRAPIMQSGAGWASGGASTSRLNKVLAADGHFLRAGGVQRLQPWTRHVQLRGCGRGGVDGGTTGSARSQDSQIRNLQCRVSSALEGDEAAGISEEALGVFTKFVDEQLMQILHNSGNPVRQTILMTDGTDTRPYRLLWPSPSLIFDVSPEPAFSATSRQQIEIGLKVPQSCLLQHVSMDLMQDDWGDDLVANLLREGYRGDVSTVWVVEMPKAKLSEPSLQGIFAVCSDLLMKGSTFLGVISSPWMGTSELETRALLRRLFVSQGLTVNIFSYEELKSKSHLATHGISLTSPPNLPFAFIAHQQRLSGAQVEYAQSQIMVAEEVDEDGFEDSW